MNRNILQTNFREELLREDVVSVNLNEVSEVYKNLLLADIKSGKILANESNIFYLYFLQVLNYDIS